MKDLLSRLQSGRAADQLKWSALSPIPVTMKPEQGHLVSQPGFGIKHNLPLDLQVDPIIKETK